MPVLRFLFQSDVSTVLTAVITAGVCLGITMWASRDKEPKKGRGQ